MTIAKRYNLLVIEDNAQAILATYRGKKLGTIGQLATLSFHETKNVIAGEGGALLINETSFFERAEIIREKGTDRSRFFRGQVDKYSWVDIGSSYLPGELIAAFLASQLEHAEKIIARRREIWNRYWEGFSQKTIFSKNGYDLPYIPPYCEHNAHVFYIKTPDLEKRSDMLAKLSSQGICAVFHYVPLHSSSAGRKYGRFHGIDSYTTKESERLVRLPLYYTMTDDEVDFVIDAVMKSLS